ncbi:polyprotein [Trichoderma harzianum hypovirus 1]|uniref:Polyprotein n=1 Tax=Trichoderma harzianum hypovirus 1 TaxID=2664558 RepID=A0AAE6TZ99_9VIRU|nr:polyprotein [Trichoderma harzianum hypovirus 1]QGA30968.1 polyprotein [Trichoderma harzianum hypovirus 1]
MGMFYGFVVLPAPDFIHLLPVFDLPMQLPDEVDALGPQPNREGRPAFPIETSFLPSDPGYCYLYYFKPDHWRVFGGMLQKGPRVSRVKRIMRENIHCLSLDARCTLRAFKDPRGNWVLYHLVPEVGGMSATEFLEEHFYDVATIGGTPNAVVDVYLTQHRPTERGYCYLSFFIDSSWDFVADKLRANPTLKAFRDFANDNPQIWYDGEVFVGCTWKSAARGIYPKHFRCERGEGVSMASFVREIKFPEVTIGSPLDRPIPQRSVENRVIVDGTDDAYAGFRVNYPESALHPGLCYLYLFKREDWTQAVEVLGLYPPGHFVAACLKHRSLADFQLCVSHRDVQLSVGLRRVVHISLAFPGEVSTNSIPEILATYGSEVCIFGARVNGHKRSVSDILSSLWREVQDEVPGAFPGRNLSPFDRKGFPKFIRDHGWVGCHPTPQMSF